MKGRCAGALLLALCLFALAGCGGNAKGTEYAVYYCNQAAGEEAALVAEKRVLPPDTEPVEGLLNLLLSPPQSENLTMAIPSGVTLRKWTLYNGLLTVDFSSGYGVLSGIDLTLADYSVVLTLTQLEGVEAVMITAEGEMLSFRDHQRLTAEEAWSALQSGMSEETAQDVSYCLRRRTTIRIAIVGPLCRPPVSGGLFL